ncbi:hypothetical protein GOODEAATRI_023423, partial [Goodea atripinnis]
KSEHCSVGRESLRDCDTILSLASMLLHTSGQLDKIRPLHLFLIIVANKNMSCHCVASLSRTQGWLRKDYYCIVLLVLISKEQNSKKVSKLIYPDVTTCCFSICSLLESWHTTTHMQTVCVRMLSLAINRRLLL